MNVLHSSHFGIKILIRLAVTLLQQEILRPLKQMHTEMTFRIEQTFSTKLEGITN